MTRFLFIIGASRALRSLAPDQRLPTHPDKAVNSFLLDLSLAVRNVARQRRRSGMAVVAVSFGIVALLVAGGFIEWIFVDMREATIRSQLGHIQVVRPGYFESGLSDPFAYLLPEDSKELREIDRLDHLKVLGPRIAFSGLISHGEATVSFVGEGVEPDKELLLSRTLQIPKGNELSGREPNGIIMGLGLAANLGVDIGDKVVLIANTPSGGVNAVECRVRGFFSTISKAYDDSAIRVPISTVRKLLRVSGSHVWVMLLDETASTQPVIAALRTAYANKGLEFVPWSDLADFYNKTVELFKKQVGVMKLIIGIIIVLSISNTLMMSVMERTGEIGTSMALGVKRTQIMRQFLLEGLMLGVIGGVIGLVLGWICAQAISAIGIPMPPPPGMARGYTGEILVNRGLVGDAFILAVGTTLLASLYPAWKASRMVIVEALRFNR